MEASNRWAFKEWAAICAALAAGRQSLLLRKGGIHEGPGGFQVEHSEFWLFATHFHQTADAVCEEERPFLSALRAPPAGQILLPAYAKVERVIQIAEERELPLLADLHRFSERTVSDRFHYRSPGLFVLLTRIFKPAKPLTIPDSPHFGGCRTWVDLPGELPTDGLRPALDDEQFEAIAARIDKRFSRSTSL